MRKGEIRKEILRKLSRRPTSKTRATGSRRDERDQARREKIKIEKDRVIKEKLLALSEFKKAKVIAFYVSLESEVDTGALIDEALRMGKRVVVPVIVGDNLELSEIKDRQRELKVGPYGIMQPVFDARPFSIKDVDLIIVPGIAFTEEGKRLGRGKGFYDKFLKKIPRKVKRIGLAYDFQIVKDLPTTPQDLPVDIIVTN